MSKIQSPPFGLQDFLGTKNFGVNPAELAQTVIPTVDTQPFTDALRLRTKLTSVSGGGGASATITVPDNQLYRLHAVGAYPTAVGSTETFNAALQINSGRDLNQWCTIGTFAKPETNTTGTSGNGAAALFGQPLLLPPDSVIRVVVLNFSGTSITLTLSAMYQEYAI